jgi:hypothetical protein
MGRASACAVVYMAGIEVVDGASDTRDLGGQFMPSESLGWRKI